MNEQTLFVEALERTDPHERSAFLDQACEGDPDLRKRIDRLLAQHQHAGAFLEESPLAPARTVEQAAAERPGTVIGPYKLLQLIGEGGMGVVWMAEQTRPVQRKVALKVIKPGMDSRQVIARFEAERQALALMDHVNIARVLDAGATDLGRPYFVMELVHGVPITKYCDDNHLTPRERLELFVPVCQAIQHAHQKGIIHRDVKPSNVMVTLYDGKPVPKVIDFGVAKATEQKLTERTLFTQYGTLVGTLEYMSPEQAEMSALGVDTRSDIYSLGVLLYELLTGSTPLTHKRFKEAAYAEILRIIMEEEPPRPSTRLSDSGEALASISARRKTEPAKLTKLVRGELDWIVMKTLEKDRNRRYETAKDFAADVQRYLADEPVQACPPSRWYRFRKFARRNKVALITIATVTVALLAGTAISTWQAVRATNAEKLAEERLLAERDARHDAEKANEKASLNFGRARDAVRRMLTRVAQEELVDVPWMEPVRKALLEDALQFYEQLLAERTADPEIRLATAHARLDLAMICGKYGEAAQEKEAIRRALELLEPLVKEFAENGRYRAGLARALHHQSHQTAWEPERWKEAEQLLRRAVELQESVVAATPDSAENAFQLADTLQMLGNALNTGGRSEEAEAAYRRAVSIGERVTAKDPSNPAHLRAQFRGLTSIAVLLSEKEPAQAEALLLRAQVLAARYQAAGRKTGLLFDSSAFALASLDQALGNLYHAQGRTKEAQAAFRRAVAVYQKFTSDFPSLRNYREHLAWASNRLADSLTDPADRNEAEKCYQDAIDAHEKLVAGFPKAAIYSKGLLHAYRGLGNLLEATGRSAEAEKALGRALVTSLKLSDESPGDIESRISAAWLCNRVGAQLERAKRPEEAEQRYRQAVKLFQSVAADRPTAPEYRATLGHWYGHLTTLHWDNGKLKEAEESARQSLAVFDKLATDFPDKAAYRQALANTYQWQLVRILVATGRPKEVEEARRQALAIWQKLAADFPRESQYWHKLGTIQHALGQYGEAVTSLTTALELQPELWESWHWRGLAFGSLGQWDKAVADQTKAIERKPDHPSSWQQRGVGHNRLGQWDKAVADHTKAIELKPDYWEAYHARGLPLGKLGQWDEMIGDQTKALELNPKHRWTWARRGDGYSALKQWDKALADYTQAIGLGATEPTVWVSKAAVHAQLNQPEKAMADLRQAAAKGFRDATQLKNRSDLAGLRSREDFKQLVAELEAKKK